MNLDARLIKKENALATIEVIVGQEEVKKEFESIIKGYQERSTLPGFRKGKVPLHIIKNKFKEDILNDVLNKLINRSYFEAVKKVDIKPFTYPDIKIKKFNEEENLEFEADVQLSPEVELDKYRDLPFIQDEYALEPEDVEQELKKLLERSADLILNQEKRSQENDVLLLDIHAFDMENHAVKELSHENYKMELKKEEMDESFYQVLLGCSMGEEKELQKTYPETFNNKRLAGKTVLFKIKVKEVREKKLPSLDDDFAKDIGYESLNDLRQVINGQLKGIIEKQSNDKLEEQIIKKTVENAKFLIPEKLILDRTSLLMKEFQQNLHNQGHNIKELVSQKVIDMEKLMAELREKALEEIKSSLVLITIGEKEKIKVEPSEMEDFFKEEAEKHKVGPEEYKKRLNEETQDYIRNYLLNKKVLMFLRQNNRIKKGKTLKFAELLKEMEKR